MSDYIYLIKNGDLYNIGCSKSLAQIKKSLYPGILEESIQTDEAKAILEILRKKYSDKCIPQTNYYRLTKAELIECKLVIKGVLSKENLKPFFIGGRLIFTFFFAWICLSGLIITLLIEPIFKRFS